MICIYPDCSLRPLGLQKHSQLQIDILFPYLSSATFDKFTAFGLLLVAAAVVGDMLTATDAEEALLSLPLILEVEPAMAADGGMMPDAFMRSRCGCLATITVLHTARSRKKSCTRVDWKRRRNQWS